MSQAYLLDIIQTRCLDLIIQPRKVTYVLDISMNKQLN